MTSRPLSAFERIRMEQEDSGKDKNGTGDEESQTDMLSDPSDASPTPTTIPQELTGSASSLIRSSRLADLGSFQDRPARIGSPAYTALSLNRGDRLLVRGCYRIETDKPGAISIDGTPLATTSTLVNAPAIAALPVVTCTPSHAQSTLPVPAAVRLYESRDGSDGICSLYPALKKIYPARKSFEVVLDDASGCYGTTIPEDWYAGLDQIDQAGRVLFVGPKNSGKSTFLRLALNRAVSASAASCPVDVLDLDPDQTEYSPPLCISLTRHSTTHFGAYFPLQNATQVVKQSFVGFTEPPRAPEVYTSEMKRLVELATSQQSNHLFINASAAWTKGFGVELMRQLADQMNITRVVFLTNSEKPEAERFLQVLPDSVDVLPLTGFHVPREEGIDRYNSTHLHAFKLLSYFHSTASDRFDYSALLQHSPYRLPFHYISLIGFYGSSHSLNREDLPELLEFQVVAMLTMDGANYAALQKSQILQQEHQSLPLLFPDCGSSITKLDYRFEGLALVHSVNENDRLLNLYTPIPANALAQKLTTGNHLVLVKGSSSYPVEELFPSSVYDDEPCNVPYLSFNTDIGTGGRAVAPRRNIQRRNIH